MYSACVSNGIHGSSKVQRNITPVQGLTVSFLVLLYSTTWERNELLVQLGCDTDPVDSPVTHRHPSGEAQRTYRRKNWITHGTKLSYKICVVTPSGQSVNVYDDTNLFTIAVEYRTQNDCATVLFRS